MSSRSHLWLRLGALALLAAAAVWPRTTPARSEAPRSHELVRAGRTEAPRTTPTRAGPRPHPMKVVVADADDAQLTN